MQSPYTDYEPEAPPPASTKPKLDFTAILSTEDGRLSASYTLSNKDAEPVVVYTGVLDDGVSHVWDVYVTTREDGTVEISKRTFPIPPGTNADSIGEIQGRVLAPGEKFDESFFLDLPLKARRPYQTPGNLPDPPESIVFCLGAIGHSGAPTARGDRYPLNGPQHLFCSDAIRELSD